MSNEEIKQPSFENNILKAQKLLEKLIDPEITLSNSVEIYKDGIKELEEAQKLLDDAKLEFQELSKQDNKIDGKTKSFLDMPLNNLKSFFNI